MKVLGDIAKVIDCEHRTAPKTEEVPFGFSVGTSAVRHGRIDLARAKPISKETYVSWTRRATPEIGDLIFSREAPMGEVGMVPGEIPVCLGQRTVLMRLDHQQVDHRFLMYSLMSPHSQAWIKENSAGSTVLHLNVADVRRIPIHFLPLIGDQRRIVDLIEDHLSRLDAAESLVATSLRRLMSLRRSVLAGLYDGDPTTLGELAVDSGYGTSEKCVPDGPGPAVVRIPNLVDGRIDFTDEKRIASASADVERYFLVPGDLLIVRTNGSVDLIGRSAVVQDGVDGAFASYLIRYQLRPDRVMPEWVQAMLSTPQVRAKIEELAASSAGQHNLSLGKLNPLVLPVPTLDVQAARLSRLADIEDQVSRLRVELSTAQSRGVNLRRSLLAAAFSGRLTGDASAQSEAEELIIA